METQPKRHPLDGEVSVWRDTANGCCLTVTVYTGGFRQEIRMGEFNAWRLLAMLATVLGVELPKKVDAFVWPEEEQAP